MRILLWAPFGAGTHYWGPGTSAYRLYKSNKDSAIKITLIHTSEEQGLFTDVFEEQIKLPTLKNSGFVGKLKYFIAASRWIKENYHRYDVVHGISAFEYTYRPLIQFSSLGIPVFIKITGENGGFGDNSKLSKILGLPKKRQRNSKKVTGFISISSHITSNLLQHKIDKKRIFEIPNGVEKDRFKPLNSNVKIQLRADLDVNNKFTFIYVGGLTYNKRVVEIVKAIILLKSKNITSFQFLVIGPDRSGGMVESDLRSLIKQYDLDDMVSLVSHTTTPELYLQISDVFLLVSKKEGMSNALLEAMSCGLPIIATKISGSVDLVIRNHNGVFSSGSTEDIANRMKWYLENKDVRAIYGENSRKIIEDKYSHEIVLKQHIELFYKYGKK